MHAPKINAYTDIGISFDNLMYIFSYAGIYMYKQFIDTVQKSISLFLSHSEKLQICQIKKYYTHIYLGLCV